MAEAAPQVASEVTAARATSFVYQKPPTKAPPKPLAPPVPISPTIRFARWAALFTGLAYGYYRNRSLTKKEAALHEIEERNKAAHAAVYAREKAMKTREEMIALAKQVGQPIPDDFEKQFPIPDVAVVHHGKH